MKIAERGITLVAMPVAFLALVLASETWLVNREEELLMQEERSRRVTALSSDIAAMALNCRLAAARYAATPSSSTSPAATPATSAVPDPPSATPSPAKSLIMIERAEKQLGENMAALTDLAAADTVEAQYIATYSQLLRDLIEQCKRSAAHTHADDGVRLADLSRQIYAKADAIRMRELYLTGNKPSEISSFREKFQWFIAVTAVLGVLLALALATWFSRQIASRLVRLSDNAKRLAEEQPLLAPQPGDDEIASVDRAFHNAADSLAQAKVLRQEFVSMVTHDLRSPLTAISLVLQSLRYGLHGDLSPEAQKAVDGASASGNRLMRLVEQLLLHERITAGSLSLDYTEGDLLETVALAVDGVSSLAQEAGIDIQCERTAPCMLEADHDRIVQVLINLIGNAVKFSPSGSTVLIKVSQPVGQPGVRVEVIDSGRGLSREEAAVVFDRYKQIERRDKERGAGLGLAICKGIVEAHEGEIGVVSESGKGSCFWFTLPVGAAKSLNAVNLPASSDL